MKNTSIRPPFAGTITRRFAQEENLVTPTTVIVSVAGGLIGIGVGIGSGMLVTVLTPLQPSVPIAAIALAVGVSGSIDLIFGVIPARQAARLDPIVALRSA